MNYTALHPTLHPPFIPLPKETSVENLVLLCPHHHRLVHEGGWSVDAADGTWRFVAPTGTPAVSPETQAWTGNLLTWLQERAYEHGVDIGLDSNEPLWDGTRPDYDWAVGALMGVA